MAAASAGHDVFMGNLRDDVRVGALKQSIIHLLHQVGVSITKHSIDVKTKPHSSYAFVNLSSEQEVELVLDLLNTQHVLDSLDLTGIVKDGRRFRVAPRLECWQLMSNSSSGGGNHRGQMLHRPQHQLKASSHGPSSHWNDGHPNNDSFPAEPSDYSQFQKPPAVLDPRKTYTKVAAKAANEDHYYVKREKSSSMFDSLIKNRSHYGLSDSEMDCNKQGKPSATFSNGEKGDDELDSDEDIVIPNSKKFKRRTNQRKKRQAASKLQESKHSIDLNDLRKASDPGKEEKKAPGSSHDPLFHRESYILDERLGTENRLLEFKRGQGKYVQRQLSDHVAVYMSAFLNTEGGTLLVGVNDEGEVKGVDIDRSLEDRLRRAIDVTVQRIKPGVFPNMYRVEFVPVMDDHDQPLGDRQVVEVGVWPGTSGQLYQTPAGDVYVRRDGSVQGPLHANDIQEWTRMMLFEEQRKKDNEIQNLREKEKRLMAELAEHRAKADMSPREGMSPSSPRTDAEPAPNTEGADQADSKTPTKDKSKVCVIL